MRYVHRYMEEYLTSLTDHNPHTVFGLLQEIALTAQARKSHRNNPEVRVCNVCVTCVVFWRMMFDVCTGRKRRSSTSEDELSSKRRKRSVSVDESGNIIAHIRLLFCVPLTERPLYPQTVRKQRAELQT